MSIIWRDCFQDGSDFYAKSEHGEDLGARYPGMVKHDYDMAGAAKARAKFLADRKAAGDIVEWEP